MTTTTTTTLLSSQHHSYVALETATSLKLLQQGLAEVDAFCKLHPREHEFHTLRNNLQGLEQFMITVQEWHQQHVAKYHATTTTTTTNDTPERRLFLAEIALLLVTPYFHRLLTFTDRDDMNSRNNTPLSPDRNRAREMHFANIDPLYVTRYTGICLAGLMRSVERNPTTLSCCLPFKTQSRLTRRQRGDAKILASRFFGAQTCLELILNLTAVTDDDLILEHAVGSQSRLWVDGIQETALLYDRRAAEEHVYNFTGWVLMANTVVDAGFYSKFSVIRLARMAMAGMYYIWPCNWEEAEHRGQICYTGSRKEIAAKLHFARYVWNLPETPLVKGLYRLGLPRIKIDHEFFVPPLPAEECAMMDGSSDPVFARVVCHHALSRLPRTVTASKAKSFNWNDGDDTIITTTTPLLSSSLPKIPRKISPTPQDVLIIHYHGGGFISMSSFAHENYTRIWARDTGACIVSVDYRLAPDFKFPTPFNDAYRAYKFIVQRSMEQLGFIPRKIIVTGDSAGGNMAAAVATQAVMDGIRVPDAMLLAYPAVDLRRQFWPSLLWSVQERLLPYVFVESCLSAYLHPDPQKATQMALDPRCSPALAPDAILRKLPKTRIVCGDADPLYDQSVRYAHHLARLGVDCKLKVYESMPHGFLSFGWPVVGVPEVRKCIDDCTEILKDLMVDDEDELSALDMSLNFGLGLSPDVVLSGTNEVYLN